MGCTDACSFCNILTCTAGTWARKESFPAPCFTCGDLRCQNGQQYCETSLPGMAGAATYACKATPSACLPTPTCACLAPSTTGGTCQELGSAQLRVTFAAP